MKKRTKLNIMLSSIAAIALAGSVLAGGTFALFTSESKTNIAVNSGKVNVAATVSNFLVYSPTSISTETGNAILNPNNAASMNTDGVSGTFYNGGTAALDASAGTITLDRMTPGDKVTFKLDIQNNSNVKTKYRMSITKVDTSDSNLFSALDINIGGMSPNYYTKWQVLDIPSSEGQSIANYNCSIELPTNISGEEYMNKTCKIQILVEAIQYNAQTSDAEASKTTSKTVEYGTTERGTETKIYDGEDESSSKIEAVIPANSVSTDVTSLTLIKTPTEVPGNIEITTGTSAISNDVKIIDQDGNKVVAQGETYFTITVDIGENLDLIYFYHNAELLTSVESTAAFTTAGQYYYNKTTGKLTFTTADFSTFTATYKFSGGLGTEDAPYLIGSVDDLKTIGSYYETYTYYKISDDYKNGKKDFDLSNYSGYNILNGSFDGNGANLINLRQCLFVHIQDTDSEDDRHCVFKNLSVNMKNSGNALIWKLDSETQITFDKVNIHGVIIGEYNISAFLQYGNHNHTCNAIFANCTCDASILATSSNEAAILIGHIYCNDFNITVDQSTIDGIEKTKLYANASAVGHKFFGIGSCSCKINGTTYGCADEFNKFSILENKTANPVKTDSGYSLTVVDDAVKIVAKISTQLTAYDSDGNKISKYTGITNTNNPDIIKNNVATGDSIELLSMIIKSVEIKNELVTDGTNYPRYELSENGKLTIYTNSTDCYASGTVSLIVTQYDSNNAPIATGSLTLATLSYQGNDNLTWTIDE